MKRVKTANIRIHLMSLAVRSATAKTKQKSENPNITSFVCEHGNKLNLATCRYRTGNCFKIFENNRMMNYFVN